MTMDNERGQGRASDDLYERARRVLPGGVTAGARANRALGRPFYIERADGPYVFDPDGKRYVDVCTSNGASLLGHGHPAVVAAVRNALDRGLACAYDGSAQVALGERLVEQVPSLDMVRFTTTGTEATYYAGPDRSRRDWSVSRPEVRGAFPRLQRPPRIQLLAVGRGGWGRPTVRGPAGEPRPAALGRRGGDRRAFQRLGGVPRHTRRGRRRAGGRRDGADQLRLRRDPPRARVPRAGPEETARRGIVLVFDEILSGYRTGVDCAQGYLGVTPDLCTLGKALGGGVPLSAFGGRRDLMSQVSPIGRAIHTGTYNAHLIPVLAALAFLDTASGPGFYDHLLGLSDRLGAGLQRAFDEARLPVRVQAVGARFAMYFGLDPKVEVSRYRQAAALDWDMMSAFCREMYSRGVYVNPAWHHGLSSLHTEALVDEVVEKAAESASAVVG